MKPSSSSSSSSFHLTNSPDFPGPISIRPRYHRGIPPFQIRSHPRSHVEAKKQIAAPVAEKPPAPIPVAETGSASLAEKPLAPALVIEKPPASAPVTENPRAPAPVAEKPPALAPVVEKGLDPVVEKQPTVAPVAEKLPTSALIAEKPRATASIAEKPPVAEKLPASAPVVEKPRASAPVVEKPLALAITAEKPPAAALVVEKPLAQTPVKEKGPTPVAEKPLALAPVAEKGPALDPVAEKPQAPAPVAEKGLAPITAEPSASAPVPEELQALALVVEEPAALAPAAEEPPALAPVAEEPPSPTPVAEEPPDPAPAQLSFKRSKAMSASSSDQLPDSTEKEIGNELLLDSAVPSGQHSQHSPLRKKEITDSIEMEGVETTSQENKNKVNQDVEIGSHHQDVEIVSHHQDVEIGSHHQHVEIGSHQYAIEKKEVITSSKVDNNATPVMFDKFQDFPEDLKRCLLYCYLFPFGYEFERETLVQLWIAAKLINGKVTDRIEDQGDKWFEILACTKYIVPSQQRDKAYAQIKYKVNQSKFPIWYLDEGSSAGEFVRTDAGGSSDISEKTRHLSLSDEKFDPQVFEVLQKCENLRTLLLFGHFGYSVSQVLEDLFLILKFLTTLDLSQTKISELPSTIGELECLQYLDLSDTTIQELPEVLCSLKSLQTLKLRDCFYLLALPTDMRELTNLRHLDFNVVRQLSYMPEEMGKLKNLQTLPGFIVGIEDGCGIQELSDLSNITGSFCISRLENILSVDEAKNAKLKNKKYLTKLELRWEECRKPEIEKQILECLEPHSGLQDLEIQFYSGSVLCSWVSNPLFSITSLTLYQCVKCCSLPSIGDLPKLKSLTIVAMYKVRHINRLLSNHGEGSRNQQDCAFPELEKLILDDMLDLEEWTGVEPGDFPKLFDVCIRYCPKLSDLSFMSHLRSLKYLELSNCTELQLLPDGDLPASLESLIIQDCPKLQEGYCNDGEGRKKIAHVPSLWIDDGGSSSD